MHPLGLAVLVLLAPSAIALAIPMRRMPLFVGWLCILFFAYLLYPEAPNHSSPFSGFRPFLTVVILFSSCMAIIIKSVAGDRAVGKRAASSAAIGGNGHRSVNASSPALDFPVIATGTLAGLFAVYLFAIIGAAVRPAWVAHAAFVGATIGAALTPWAGGALNAGQSARQFAIAMGCSAVIVCAGSLGWIGERIGAVVARAEEIAGDKPYCIQVAGTKSSYTAATARLDFSPQTMRANCSGGRCWQHHAVLVVENKETQLLNWSYRRQDFSPGVLNIRTDVFEVLCRPVAHFARDLPLL